MSLFFALWALATPQWTPPDSQAHEMRAYGAGSGNVLPDAPGGDGAELANTDGIDRVPAGMLESASSAGCYAHQPAVSAACIVPVSGDATIVDFVNPAGRYLPVYYVLAGWPSSLVGFEAALTANHIMALLLAALFLGMALAAATTMRRPALAMTGVAVATSPMVMYFGGVLNPNSLEITAAMGMGACSIAAFSKAPSLVQTTLLRWALVAATAMCLTRFLSPIWLACWGLMLMVCFRWPAVRLLLRREHLPWVALPALGAVGNVLWTLTLGGNVVGAEPRFDLSRGEAWTASLQQFDATLPQVVAAFGWGDTFLSSGEYNYYIIAAIFLVGTAWLFMTSRQSAALAVLIVLSYFAPIALQAMHWNANGAVWQARYSLPLLTLIPITAMFLAADDTSMTSQVWSRLRWIYPPVLALLAYVHVRAYLTQMQRNVSGMGGDTFDGPWQPALESRLLVAVHAGLVIVSLVVLSYQLSKQNDDKPGAEDGEPLAPDVGTVSSAPTGRGRAHASGR